MQNPQNQGTRHIAEKILKSLDSETVLNCRIVSRSFKTVINNPKIWMNSMKSTSIEVIKHWTKIQLEPLRRFTSSHYEEDVFFYKEIIHENKTSCFKQVERLMKSWEFVSDLQPDTFECEQASLCLLRVKREFCDISKNADLLSPILNGNILVDHKKAGLTEKIDRQLKAQLAKSPLQTASENHSYELAIWYLTKKESSATYNVLLWHIPLQIAAMKGHMEGIVSLQNKLQHKYLWFSNPSKPNCILDPNNFHAIESPLVLAVKHNNVKVAEILLPLVNTVSTRYKGVLKSALHQAAENGNHELVNLIHRHSLHSFLTDAFWKRNW